MPCIWPAAPRDSRRQNQKNSANGARMMTQFSSSAPNPGDEVPPVTLTPAATIWSIVCCPTCAGKTTV